MIFGPITISTSVNVSNQKYLNHSPVYLKHVLGRLKAFKMVKKSLKFNQTSGGESITKFVMAFLTLPLC